MKPCSGSFRMAHLSQDPALRATERLNAKGRAIGIIRFRNSDFSLSISITESNLPCFKESCCLFPLKDYSALAVAHRDYMKGPWFFQTEPGIHIGHYACPDHTGNMTAQTIMS